MANSKEEVLRNMERKIDGIMSGKPLIKFTGSEKTNFINRVGKSFGYEQLSSDDGELYYALTAYLDKKQNGDKMKNNKIDLGKDSIQDLFNESLLKESALEIPQSKNILRYDDDIVVKTIKEITKKEFNNVTIEQIKGDEGGAFYNIIFSLELEDDIRDDIERKRFYIMQTMAKFKAQFCAAISAILPVVNMNTGSYDFTKNSSKLKFGATICLSHTNDRDWVSGIYRGPEEKKKTAIADYENKEDRVMPVAKSMIKELDSLQETSPKKHAISPIKLAKAIKMYNDDQINQKMLETAIKACGRSELEFYVLRSVGIEASVDISDVTPESSVAEGSEDKSSKNEIEESTSIKEVNSRFDKADFEVEDAFKAQEILRNKGVQANARTGTIVLVKWPKNKCDADTIAKAINGVIVVS